MHSSVDRILSLLKMRGPSPASAIARHLGITVVGARKHLAALLAEGLVRHIDTKSKVGRPARLWSLTEAAASRFPDTHAALTVDLISTLRDVFGEPALDRLIDTRGAATLDRYRSGLAGKRGLADRVAALARMRDEEGYMAAWESVSDGAFLLLENHCPICAAARVCQGFCRSELEIFASALGKGVTVERTEHMLLGARRCAYRIAPRPAARP